MQVASHGLPSPACRQSISKVPFGLPRPSSACRHLKTWHFRFRFKCRAALAARQPAAAKGEGEGERSASQKKKNEHCSKLTTLFSLQVFLFTSRFSVSAFDLAASFRFRLLCKRCQRTIADTTAAPPRSHRPDALGFCLPCPPWCEKWFLFIYLYPHCAVAVAVAHSALHLLTPGA